MYLKKVIFEPQQENLELLITTNSLEPWEYMMGNEIYIYICNNWVYFYLTKTVNSYFYAKDYFQIVASDTLTLNVLFRNITLFKTTKYENISEQMIECKLTKIQELLKFVILMDDLKTWLICWILGLFILGIYVSLNTIFYLICFGLKESFMGY